jgi:hypothetical protein
MPEETTPAPSAPTPTTEAPRVGDFVQYTHTDPAVRPTVFVVAEVRLYPTGVEVTLEHPHTGGRLTWSWPMARCRIIARAVGQ